MLSEKNNSVLYQVGCDNSYQFLKETCEKLGYHWKKSCMNQVTVSTTNRRNKLIFKENLVEMDEKFLVDFQFSMDWNSRDTS